MKEQKGTIHHVMRLLRRVDQLEKQSKEISRLKRENYNIFSLLRKEHDEEHLHSAFIADLLDPNGTHEMGSVFGELFFGAIETPFPITQYTYVATEQTLPQGRADVYLETGDHTAIIENKIYAADQPAQLLRYQQYLRAKSPGKFLLLYLTLKGDLSAEAEELNRTFDEEEKISYTPISYHTHVTRWLEQCLEKATIHPPLRETIRQYLNLVKKLTGQLTTNTMQQEVKAAILSNLRAADLIESNAAAAKADWVAEFLNDLKAALHLRLKSWDISINVKGEQNIALSRYATLDLRLNSWPSGVSIAIQGQPNMFEGYTACGIVMHRDLKNYAAVNELLSTVPLEQNNATRNEWWIARAPIFNFSDIEELAQVVENSSSRQSLLNRLSDEITNLCESCRDRLAGYIAEE